MQEAIASGDPERIRQLQLQQQERYLEQAAEASRKAADEQARAAQEAYREQRDDLKTAMQEREQTLEDAYSEQRDAELRAWDDRREEQRIKLQEDIDDWVFWIQNKKKTWQQFLKWLSDHGWNVPPSWLTGDEKTPYFKLFEEMMDPLKLRLLPPRSPGMQHGGTIRAPRYINRDAVPLLAQHGETVIDRRLTDALEEVFLTGGGRGGGGPVIVIQAPNFLATTPTEVARGVASLVGPHLKRRVGFERM